MNPFNPLSIVQSTFESDDVQHELKELVEIIRAYDIYDFLRRLSALNLQKENQNRAVLLDALQSAILYNDETYYTSSAKMSAGKFSSIIKKMDSISLVHAIDPNENVFTQNVMLYDNYTVFNGIDSYPAYRLQMLCEIFFGFKNSFPLEYIKKVYFLFSAMLKISTRIAKSIGISSEPPIIEAASKYTEAIIKREDYFAKKFKDNHIAPQNVFHLVILNGIGRAVSCSLKNVFSDYGIVHLNPFELHCISINEMKHTGFLPRYFVAKSSVKTLTSGLFSELNCITIYTDNHYSFYLSDDASPDNPLMLITPGGAPYYIGKALLAEDAILIKSYDDKTKIPVVLSDVKRKIYFDENFATKNVLSFCIRFSDVIIWLTSDVDFISDVPDINVIQSLMDMTSYWLSESREIIERINKKKIADEKSDVLGDIDVLIIDEKKHRIVVAEVKNFDFSKNPYEIQAEYQKMFVDGKKKSFATKHKRRVEWVIAHFDDVRAQYSLPRNKWTVHGVFITNEPLMSVNTYRKKLSVLSEAELSVESLRKIQ